MAPDWISALLCDQRVYDHMACGTADASKKIRD
jgi:hypothetical protein